MKTLKRARKSVLVKREREKIYRSMTVLRRVYWIEADKIAEAGNLELREMPKPKELRQAVQALRDVLNESSTVRFRGTF